jgi:hypothetical protein
VERYARLLYVLPIKPDADMKRRLIDPRPVHYFQLFFHPRGHARRREKLNPHAECESGRLRELFLRLGLYEVRAGDSARLASNGDGRR